jgi:hypothetical protein
MNKFISTVLLLVAFIITSCKQKTATDNLKIIPVKYVSPGKKELLSKIVSATRYIKLETRPDFLLGDIVNAKMFDKLYCMNSNKINVFDLKGNALFEINHYRSREPGGYMELSTFQVDTVNDVIEIWDRFGKRINRYDSNNGKFLSNQKFDVQATFFIRDQKGDYCFFANYWSNPLYMGKDEIYQLLKFDKEGNFLNKFLKEEFNNKIIWVVSYNTLYTYKGSIYLNPPANNFVYTLKKDSLLKIYEFDFGKYALNNEFFKEYKRWDVMVIEKTNFAWNTGNFREYNFGYSYSYHQGKNACKVFLSKTTKENYVVSFNFENDLDGGWPTYPQFVQDDVFLTCYEARILKKIYLETKEKFSSSQWDQFKVSHANFCTICDNLNELDNPVIIVMTPKEF